MYISGLILYVGTLLTENISPLKRASAGGKSGEKNRIGSVTSTLYAQDALQLLIEDD